MTRREWTGVAVLAGVFALLWIADRRKAAVDAVTPPWTDPQQPAEGVAEQLTTLSPGESWAANRCRPMTACCNGRTAGRRVRRTYPATLSEDPNSLISMTIRAEV